MIKFLTLLLVIYSCAMAAMFRGQKGLALFFIILLTFLVPVFIFHDKVIDLYMRLRD